MCQIPPTITKSSSGAGVAEQAARPLGFVLDIHGVGFSSSSSSKPSFTCLSMYGIVDSTRVRSTARGTLRQGPSVAPAEVP